MEPPVLGRAVDPEETYTRVMPYLRGFGITRVARHTGLDNVGIPVWCAFTPNSRSIVVAQGKGLTDHAARTSAVMEALERAVACEPKLEKISSTPSGLQARHMRYHTLSCLIAQNQTPVADEDNIEWVSAYDLSTGKTVFLPYQAVVLDRTVTACRYWQSSDGLASGNTLDEAILHGLLERIERDAFALWQVSSDHDQRQACIDPKSLDNDDVTDLINRMESAGLVVRLFDLTNDTRVPCYACFIVQAEKLVGKAAKFVEVTYGSGAHFQSASAAIRALTEAAQSRLTYIGGSRDDVYPETYARPLPVEIARLFDARPESRQLSASAPFLGIADLVQHLAAQGISETFAVPLSDPDLPFSVAKVIVPQLENPEGKRRQRFGNRAMSRALMS